MDYFVFSKISGYYLLINENVGGINARTGLFFPATTIESIFESDTCHGEILNDLFDHKISFTPTQYSISLGENYLLLLAIVLRWERFLPDFPRLNTFYP